MEASSVKTICAFCLKDIMVRPSKFKELNNYCSRNCFHKRLAENNSNQVNIKCETCDEYFLVPCCRSKTAKYCCRHCSNIGLSRDKKLCKNCNVVFQPRRPNSKYCSQICRTTASQRAIITICNGCYEEFSHPPSSKRIYCSRTCMLKTKVSQLDKLGCKLLSDLGINYESQFVIGRFTVDAFISELNLVIQFDGDYWHGNPDLYSHPNKTQRKRIATDKSHDAYMKVCGYKVYRIWETDLKHNSSKFTSDIVNMMEK